MHAASAEQNKDTYVIIPVHNRKETTLACLTQLQANGDFEHYSIIVVDDGSTDGTAQAIQERFPRVNILYGDGDLWWTGAIKLGMQYALEHQAQNIIWLNDDCWPAKGSLKILVDFLEAHPKTIAGAACYLKDHQTLIETGCLGRKRLSALPTTQVKVDSLSGYCLGLPGSLCSAIGLPDEKRFPHYRGDDVYILQATQADFETFILGDAKVYVQETENVSHEFSQYLKQKSPTLKWLFFTKKSKYYLPSYFFYFVEKYNTVLGPILFAIKLSRFLFKYFIYLIQR